METFEENCPSATPTPTSSIGKDSDVPSETDANEVHSAYKPFQNHIRRGISKFYDGKSKSFTSLADASCFSSVKGIAKPENAYTRRRRDFMTRSLHLRSNRNSARISKRTVTSIPSALALAFAVNVKNDNTNGSGSIKHNNLSAWRSFSFADLQNCCATAATINMPITSLGNQAPPHPS